MSSPDAARLRLFQLVSPALPVGAFSYSEGLEVLVQRNAVTGVDALEQWLSDELHRGAVAIEAAALSDLQSALRRHQGGAADLSAVQALDAWLLAQREAAEVRAQQRQMGQSLLQLLTHVQLHVFILTLVNQQQAQLNRFLAHAPAFLCVRACDAKKHK